MMARKKTLEYWEVTLDIDGHGVESAVFRKKTSIPFFQTLKVSRAHLQHVIRNSI